MSRVSGLAAPKWLISLGRDSVIGEGSAWLNTVGRALKRLGVPRGPTLPAEKRPTYRREVVAIADCLSGGVHPTAVSVLYRHLYTSGPQALGWLDRSRG